MKTWLLFLAIGANQPEYQVDMLELSHIYSLKGEHVFTQTIAWRLDPGSRKYHVAQWWHTRDSSLLSPRRNALTGSWEIWVSVGKISKKIKSPVYRESHSQLDPEREDQRFLSQDDRIPVIGK